MPEIKLSKRKIKLILCILILAGMTGCRSNRYFGTPDYFMKQPGVLVLKNGEKITGDISVNNLLGNSVMVRSNPGKKKFTYPVKDVAACRLEIGVFEPVLIGREIPHMYSQPVFMERLTPDSLSISLYEAYEKLTNLNLMGDVTVQPGAEYDLEYFVRLPYDDSNVVWELSTAVLTAHLSHGLDSLFHQCPGLPEKISARDPAYDIYFFPQVEITPHVTLGRLSTSAKKEKVKTIIGVFAEYEQCRVKKVEETLF